MEARILWRQNNITGGPDDPHQNTPQEGFHAVLIVNKTTFQVPDCQYDLNTVSLLENIVEKINQK